MEIADDTEFGLGAGLWTRDMNRAYRMGRGIQAYFACSAGGATIETLRE